MLGLIIGLILLIIFGIIEYHTHLFYRKKIPKIIHVNGTRGKSSVTRLVAAGLRAGGLKTMAKTTGSAPVLIFENGNEIPILRYFGVNIKEQLKIIRFAAKRNIDVLVLECMAITPEYQWMSEHKMVRSNIGVITNSRLDHLDLMGPGLKNVTLSLCNSLPKNGIAFTSENKVFPLIRKYAEKFNTELHYTDPNTISNEEMKEFSHVEHKENVALSVKICEHCGVEKDVALKGMYKAKWDVGATEIFELKTGKKKVFFVHSFAANDPESTEFIFDYIRKLHPHLKSVAIILNTRADRMFRSKQLIKMLTKIKFDELFLIGQHTANIKSYAHKHNLRVKITDCGWVDGDTLVQGVVKSPPNEILLFGIGNIGGNGRIIVDYFKERNK